MQDLADVFKLSLRIESAANKLSDVCGIPATLPNPMVNQFMLVLTNRIDELSLWANDHEAQRSVQIARNTHLGFAEDRINASYDCDYCARELARRAVNLQHLVQPAVCREKPFSQFDLLHVHLAICDVIVQFVQLQDIYKWLRENKQ